MKSKLKKILSLIVAFGIVASSAAMAAGFDKFSYDYETKVLTVEGSGFDKNENITIQILHKDKAISSQDGYYNPEKMQSDFLLFMQLAAEDINPDENEEIYGYRIPVDMTVDGVELPSGNYTIRVKGDGDLTEDTIAFSSIASVDEVAKSIISACEAEDVASAKAALGALLTSASGKFTKDSNAVKTLNVNYPAFFEVNADKTLALIYKAVKTAKVDGVSLMSMKNASETKDIIKKIDAVVNCITDAAKIQALYEGTHGVVIDTKENGEYIFGIDKAGDGKFIALYNDAEAIKESVKAEFTKTYFVDKGYKTSYDELPTMESVQEIFGEGVSLSALKSIDSWTDVRDYIETLGEEGLIDMDDYKDLKSSQKSKLYTYGLSQSDVSSSEKFAEKINDKMEELLSGGSGSSGGGGGGGSFGGAGVVSGNSGVTSPVTPVDPSNPASGNVSGYTDLAGYDWAQESILALTDKKVVSGVGGGKFEPGRNVTREEMIKMLISAFGIDAGAVAEAPFADVVVNAWYAPYVAAAKAKGYTMGLGDGNFGVGDSITRQDAAVMAYRIALDMGFELAGAEKDAFADDADISPYASDAVYALKALGVISGKADGRFDPKGTCTRAEAARIIYALIK